MINFESIISAFNERGTLLAFLKKLEKALETSVLTQVGISQPADNGKVTLTFWFADDSFVETPPITLPRGADGIDGTDGIDGKSAEIKSVEVTTLPPSASATVSNKGTSLAAEFIFGIPQGKAGIDGICTFDVAADINPDTLTVPRDAVTVPPNYKIKVGDTLIGVNGGRAVVEALGSNLTILYSGGIDGTKYAEKTAVNGLSMCPSDTADLEIFKKNGDEFIAPSNGYIYSYIYFSKAGKHAHMSSTVGATTVYFPFTEWQQYPNHWFAFLPVHKGQKIEINTSTEAIFQTNMFIYAKEI